MSCSDTDLLDELRRIDVHRNKVFPYQHGRHVPHAEACVKGMLHRYSETDRRIGSIGQQLQQIVSVTRQRPAFAPFDDKTAAWIVAVFSFVD